MNLIAKFYPWVWIGLVAWFFLWELMAVFGVGVKYTLSDYIWRLEEVNSAWTFLRFFLSAACVWLFFHITFGWFA